MSETTNNQSDEEKIESLKKYAAIVYFCQILAFALAGIPLLVGLAIDFMNKKNAAGTWLESHLNWQVNSTLILLVGLTIFGLTSSTGFGIYLFVPFILLFIYRLSSGWFALNANRPAGS